jgi:hypothetical protein
MGGGSDAEPPPDPARLVHFDTDAGAEEVPPAFGGGEQRDGGESGLSSLTRCRQIRAAVRQTTSSTLVRQRADGDAEGGITRHRPRAGGGW